VASTSSEEPQEENIDDPEMLIDDNDFAEVARTPRNIVNKVKY